MLCSGAMMIVRTFKKSILPMAGGSTFQRTVTYVAIVNFFLCIR